MSNQPNEQNSQGTRVNYGASKVTLKSDSQEFKEKVQKIQANPTKTVFTSPVQQMQSPSTAKTVEKKTDVQQITDLNQEQQPNQKESVSTPYKVFGLMKQIASGFVGMVSKNTQQSPVNNIQTPKQPQPEQNDQKLESEKKLEQKLEKIKKNNKEKPVKQQQKIKQPRVEDLPAIQFIPIQTIPDIDFLNVYVTSDSSLTYQQKQEFIENIEPRYILRQISQQLKEFSKKYDGVYDNQLWDSKTKYTFTQQIKQHEYLTNKQEHLKLLKLQLITELERESEYEEAKLEYYQEYIEGTIPSPTPFKDHIFINNLMHKQKLDDSTLEAAMSVFTTQYSNLYFIPPNAYSNENIMKRFCDQICAKNDQSIIENQKPAYDFDEMQTFDTNVNTTNNLDNQFVQNTFIFSAVCTCCHWVGFIYILGQEHAYYFDSLDSQPDQEQQNKFLNFLKKLTSKTVTFKKLRISSQRNDYDCGFCLLLVLNKILNIQTIPSYTIRFTQDEVDAFRLFLLFYFLQWSTFVERQEVTIPVDLDNSIVDID
ncbi:Conserved_hypothetical protein [Hexamita inflata]|uniref:Ubiquitin-like protease family profile domain-containing protein n=1 Tax=Hexamita inflata TaxID=28002 RepID=A0AA86U8M0_9EUKA|nr:Conserved hypothetical protein [Hexamita inflata]